MQGSDAADSIRVQVVSIESDREIGWAENITVALQDRIPDLQAAVGAGVAAVSASLQNLPRPTGWDVATIEATFGVSLTAEGGALIAKAGLGATMDVTVSFVRSNNA
jgi:hypothetical protein